MPPRYSREITLPIVMGDSLKEQFRTSPCEHFCPAGNSIQKMQALVEKGEFGEALRYLRAKNPFPGVTGRVCPHFCQSNCNRAGYDACVNTRALERAVFDYAPYGSALFKRRPATGKSVGIIGGGPAGLTAAYFLALLGHDVTVYEADSVIGGKIEQVIPRERLNHAVLEAEIRRIADMGVSFVTSCRVDREKFDALRSENDAVIVAVGGTKARMFNWPGKERIVPGIDYMKAVNKGEHPATGKNVIVIGCGNAGMDAAAGAFAEGAEHVTCIDVQKPAAFAKEIANIEALGGDVEVKTELGVGTTFTVRLPLTLAIIQALMVEIRDEKYAIALGSISNIEDIPVKDIKYVEAQEVIHLRGKVIPLIRMDQVLDIEPKEEEPESLTVVIVQKGENLAGLVVDNLIGQQEIVIKSLGKYINNNKIISGATILGDGEVALILDVNVLM